MVATRRDAPHGRTKFGNVPDGSGWRYVGKLQGDRNRQVTRDRTGIKARKYHPKVGTCFVRTVIDDYSRLGYAERYDDETAVTAVGVLYRAVAWFAERGVTVERVLTDNGSAYVSHLWRDTCEELDITPKKTRPRRLHGTLGMITPNEYEQAHYAALDREPRAALEAAENP